MDIYYISIFIVVIPFVIGLLTFRHFTAKLRIFFLFVAYGVFNEFLSAFVVKVIGVNNNLPLHHLYGLITFLILGIFYRYLLAGYIKQKWIDIIIALYTIYYFFNSLFLQSIYEYPGVARAIGTFVILLLIILYFAKVMQEAKIRNLFAEPVIWISGALLIYYAYNLFYFILFNLLIDFSMEFAELVINYRIGVNLLVYSMISIAFIKQRTLQLRKTRNVI